ncbi:MAG: hypothetical protein ACJATT_005513 [Myxococcota bacterium]
MLFLSVAVVCVQLFGCGDDPEDTGTPPVDDDPLTVCTPDEYESTPPTSDSDRVCSTPVFVALTSGLQHTCALDDQGDVT